MKIGILSMQRVYNYGSFLQAYALKTVLEKRGHSVGFVDIEKENLKFKEETTKFERIVKNIDRYFFKRISCSKKNKELNELFRCEQKKILSLTDEKMNADGYDMVVIGSDEIFVADPVGPWGMSSQRFGDIPAVKETVSYAASCGYSHLENNSEADIALIKKGLSGLKNISVRDRNSYELVHKLTGKMPEINIDPVLLYDFESELKTGEKMGYPDYPYMVVYAYHNRIKSKEEIGAIKKYARDKGLKIICIGGSLPWCDEFAIIHPFQVLAYFKHAECIVTDTFHGSVIAAKLNKNFATIIRESNENKLGYLLDMLSLRDREIKDLSLLHKKLDDKADFTECNEIITREIAHSMRYLDNCGV